MMRRVAKRTNYANGTRSHRRILVSIRLVEALGDVLQGLGAYVKERRLDWQFHCVDADEFVQSLGPDVADAAIAVVSPSSTELIERIRRSRVPTVNMLHDTTPALATVKSDDDAIGRQAADYFLGRGFRQFACAGFQRRWSDERLGGFAGRLAEAGHRCQTWPGGRRVADHRFFDSRRAAQVLGRWLSSQPKPLALLACSDLVARAVLDACQLARIRVPNDVSILGVDNLVPTCELASVPLSSVPQDFPRIGFEAARLLDRLLSGRPAPRTPVLVSPGAVVVRKSTDFLAFDDEYVAAAMRIIHARGADGLRMKDLLREVPVSRRWLDLRFKALVGRTPSREMRDVRLARVQELLVRTDLSVKQVALRCGFSCAENMIRFFREAFGTAPQQYRVRRAAAGREDEPLPSSSPRARAMTTTLSAPAARPAASRAAVAAPDGRRSRP